MTPRRNEEELFEGLHWEEIPGLLWIATVTRLGIAIVLREVARQAHDPSRPEDHSVSAWTRERGILDKNLQPADLSLTPIRFPYRTGKIGLLYLVVWCCLRAGSCHVSVVLNTVLC